MPNDRKVESIDDINSMALVASRDARDLPTRDELGTLPDDENVESPEELLGEVLANLENADAKVANCLIYRITDTGEEYLMKTNALDFTRSGGIEMIRVKYGAGEYRVRVYQGNKILTHRRIKIGAPLQPENAPQKDVENLRAEVNGKFDRITAVLEKLAAPQPTNQLDQLKTVIEVARMLTPPAVTPTASAKSQLGEMRELFALARDMAGDADGKTGVLGRLAERYLPQVLEVVKEMRPANVAQTGAAPALPSPSTEHQTGEVVNFADKAKLKWALDFLMKQAAQDADPITYAELAMDNVSHMSLVELLNREDWLRALQQYEPRVSQFPDWFGKLRDEILSLLVTAGVLRVPDTDTLVGGNSTIAGASAGATNVSDNSGRGNGSGNS